MFVQILGSKIDAGSQSHQAAVVAMLSGQQGIIVTLRSGRRRLVVGISGFLAVMSGLLLFTYLTTLRVRMPFFTHESQKSPE